MVPLYLTSDDVNDLVRRSEAAANLIPLKVVG
jgi:hypothetical protein